MKIFFPLETIDCFSNMVNICFLKIPYFTRWEVEKRFWDWILQILFGDNFDVKKSGHLIPPVNLVEKQKLNDMDGFVNQLFYSKFRRNTINSTAFYKLFYPVGTILLFVH